MRSRVLAPATLARDRAAAAQAFDAAAFGRSVQERVAVVDGLAIRYVIGGSGPPVLLIHGFPETWFTWRRVLPALAERRTVVAPNLPGIGGSSPPPSYAKRTVARLLRAFARQLGHERVALVAHDVGGMVAYAYAADEPASVASMALIDSAVPGFGLERRMDVTRGGSFHFGFHARPEIAVPLVTGREEFYLGALIRAATVNQAALEEGTRAYVSAYSEPAALRAGFGYYAAMLADGEENRASFRGKLTMPVLAVAAEGENEAMPDELRAVAEVVEAAIVPDSGHFVQEERPVLLTQLLTEFLDGQEAARA